MVKYRLLSQKELEEMEQEFIEFLILNGIAADDWETMKQNHPEKGMRMIELFSDVVFDSIMRKTHFLELRDKQELKTLQCLKDRFIVVGLNASKIHDADFTDMQYVESALRDPPANLEVYTSDIKFKKTREQEIFQMIENGFEICDGKLFKTLCLVLADS